MNEKGKNKRNKKLYKCLAWFVVVAFIFANSINTFAFKKIKAATIEPQIQFYTNVNQLYMDLYLPTRYEINPSVEDFQFKYGYSLNTNGQHTLTTTSVLATWTYVGIENEYKLYRYVWTAPSNFRNNGIYLYVDANETYMQDEGFFEQSSKHKIFRYNPYISNIFNREVGYTDGYNEGYEKGQNEGFENGYGEGLDLGYGTGYADGYGEGFQSGESSQIDTNFMQGIFTSLDAFFQIHFAPNLTIGELFLAPLIIWFVWFIIKQFKGGD